MKLVTKIIFSLILTLSLFFTISCGENTNITKPIVIDSSDVAFGTSETFDLVTWNIENFPKYDTQTIDILKILIPGLNVDCIAIQEVSDAGALFNLVNQIPNWSYFISGSGDGFTTVGFLYNNQTVQVDSVATIFVGNNNPFPRAPLLVKLHYDGEEIIVISVHLKASGNNIIDESNSWDEEVRRRYACQLIDQYICDNYPNTKVIVAGDTNDQIQEPVETNVFMSFLNKPNQYKFADMSIAQSYTKLTCSFPNYYSHLDHILITDELFGAIEATGNYVKTIQIEKFITGGWKNYDKYVSDHRPVGARFKFSAKR